MYATSGGVPGVERGHGLRNAVLHRVLRQLDLDAGLLLELLDRFVERVVLRRVEALDPPDDDLFLGRSRCSDAHTCRAPAARRRISGRLSSNSSLFLDDQPRRARCAPQRRCSVRAAPGRVNRGDRPHHITAPTYHGHELALAVAVQLALDLRARCRVERSAGTAARRCPATVALPSTISPQLRSMSSSCRTHSAVFVDSLSDGAGAQPYADPRPVVNTIMLAPPATCPVADTGS